MSRHALILTAITCALAVGCAVKGPDVARDAAGRPTVTVAGTAAAAVRQDLAHRMMDARYDLVRDGDLLLTFEAPIENMLLAAAYASRYDVKPRWRVAFALLEGPAGVRVSATCQAITNPGSGFERASTFRNCPDDVRAILHALPASRAAAIAER